MRKIGLIGYGAIGASIAQTWQQALAYRERLEAILVRRERIAAVCREVGPEILVASDIDTFLSRGLDVVIEAAGHSAVIAYAQKVLLAGCTLQILSAGALADDVLRARLLDAAAAGHGRIVVPTGAFAGFDGLLTMRTAGLLHVKYSSTKPVEAWRRTLAELSHRLDALDGPQVIFAGTAGEAAKAFPRNANLAAAVALAGLGFDKTRVELIADPNSSENVSQLEAVSTVGTLHVVLTGAPFTANPKSSRITAMSAIAALHDETELIRFC